jgi:RNA polymerase sigma-70 factor, ECF subfamily
MVMKVTGDGSEGAEVAERIGRAPSETTGSGSFADLYRDRYRDVFRYVLLMLRSIEEAEDVTADTFGRAYTAWCDGRGPRGQSLPWLLLIARRMIIDRARRRRLVGWLSLHLLAPGREPAIESGTGRTEFWLWFDSFARQLPARQREVLILRYQRDLDDESIGEILGLSESGVRSLVARACETLRRNPEIWQ